MDESPISRGEPSELLMAHLSSETEEALSEIARRKGGTVEQEAAFILKSHLADSAADAELA